jgi:hypothetical protein
MELADDSGLAGSALFYDGALVHLGAFGAE